MCSICLQAFWSRIRRRCRSSPFTSTRATRVPARTTRHANSPLLGLHAFNIYICVQAQTIRVRDHIVQLGYKLNNNLFYYLDKVRLRLSYGSGLLCAHVLTPAGSAAHSFLTRAASTASSTGARASTCRWRLCTRSPCSSPSRSDPSIRGIWVPCLQRTNGVAFGRTSSRCCGLLLLLLLVPACLFFMPKKRFIAGITRAWLGLTSVWCVFRHLSNQVVWKSCE